MTRMIPGTGSTKTAKIAVLLALTTGCGTKPETTQAHEERTAQSLLATDDERKWFATELFPEDQVEESRFGYAIAISGATAVITDPLAFAAYVFVRDDGWRQQARLDAPAGTSTYAFGYAVAIDGDTLMVGAPDVEGPNGPDQGAVHVFTRSGTLWSDPVTLRASDGAGSDQFGYAVALSGDTAVVSALYAPMDYRLQGAAYVFRKTGGTWQEEAKLVSPLYTAGFWYGISVAVSGDRALVGASGYNEDLSGAAFLFTRSGSSWSEPQTLRPEDAFSGDEIGHSVALEGDVAILGAPNSRGATTMGYKQGAAYVYVRSGEEWIPSRKLTAPDGEDLDWFGNSVALSGPTAMIAAPGAESVHVLSAAASFGERQRIGKRDERAFFGGSVALHGSAGTIGSLVGQHGAFVVEHLLDHGAECEADADCRAGHCVSGVCCDSECSGECATCATGTCTLLESGSERPSCRPYVCDGAAAECPERCTNDDDCFDTHYCLEGSCEPRLPNGERCERSRECTSERCVDDRCAGTTGNGRSCSDAVDCDSGFCVDGVCCNEACRGQCESCDGDETSGTCAPVEGAPRGAREPCAGEGETCGGYCDGEDGRACTYPTDACGTSCEDGEQTESFCDGRGRCEPREPLSCDGFECADERTCRTDCETTDDCVDGFTCRENGRCEAGPTCLDSVTVEETDGRTTPCSPYLCMDGACVMRCRSNDDCAEGNVCHRDNTCGPLATRASTAQDAASCSCRMVPLGSQTNSAPFGIVVFAALCARIRRRRFDRTRIDR